MPPALDIDLQSPAVFDWLAAHSIGTRTPYPVADAEVASHVVGPIHPHWLRFLEDGRRLPLTFLDGGASSKPFPQVEDARDEFMAHYANSHSAGYNAARIATHFYDQAHEWLMRYAGANPHTHTVVLTGQGTTDAIGWVAQLLFRTRPRAREEVYYRDTVIFTGMEHHANLVPWQQLAPRFVAVPLDDPARGTFPLEGLRRALSESCGRVRLVAVTGTSNVTGILTPLKEIITLAHAHGALVLVDAAHMFPHAMGVDIPGHGLMTLQNLGADFLVFSGHKIYAPGSPGGVFVRKSLLQAVPVRIGGGIVRDVGLFETEFLSMDALPDREEAGTPNIVGAIMLGAAVSTLEAIGVQRAWDKKLALTKKAIAGLTAISGVKVYGDNNVDETIRAGVISFTVEGIHHAIVSAALSDFFNIATRDGCFCAHPYVKELMGLSADDIATYRAAMAEGDRRGVPGMVRASLGIYTVEADIDLLLAAVGWIRDNRDLILQKYLLDQGGHAKRRDGFTPLDPARLRILPELPRAVPRVGVRAGVPAVVTSASGTPKSSETRALHGTPIVVGDQHDVVAGARALMSGVEVMGNVLVRIESVVEADPEPPARHLHLVREADTAPEVAADQLSTELSASLEVPVSNPTALVAQCSPAATRPVFHLVK